MKYDDITEAIGNTPLVRIDPEVHGLRNIDLYAKLELLNPFGSVKDRAAWSMLRPMLGDAVRRGDTVVELSSGNTAKALALLAGMHGLPFRSVTNRMKIPEIKDLLLLLGAEIDELPGRSECLDPADTDDPLTRMYRTLQTSGEGYVHTDQYFNERNADAHFSGTGQEIVKDLDGRAPDYFVACVGTAGSSTGVARALRAHGADTTIVGLVAAKSDFIPGIRTIDEVHEVGLFDPGTYDAIETISADEAIDGLLTLVRRCGTLSGPTGGGAYQGAVRYLRTIDGSLTSRKSAVFIVCDRVESYLSYLRERRPALFGRPARANSLGSLSAGEIAGAPSVTVGASLEGCLVVDLRSSYAYQALHIDGSINIGEDVFETMLSAGLPFSRRQPVVLVCPVGEKSAAFAALLTRMGHPDARSLAGGIIAWRDAGAPLVRD
ncbi:cysteine synthase/rhodanese-related sulfurtransferase [Actinoplanes lutulentus]|uniref:Cysteine synthase n=1 Tax=Actinoplanes lutulentus TaxID=1287878 RepID=A0A327ZPL3_9ACTN|nr:pyridoxal-phosphate dependent enzyme [Actinoplanes lutulentus]MBB2941225.1 cysteine synthase/rhodanese-related sulfurtransferase [Actinoplanes lutulentus]RAK43534.1 cysteine synthase [Actinoplanes lutulentus]